MNELFINGRRIDLGENTNIGITFCANNIGELQNRQGNFTNTFKLPFSKANKEILEWSHLQTTSSLMPYKKNKATYIENGIEIISDGVAEISSVDSNYFYINVYSGNLDLIDAIGNLTVGELYANDTVYDWNLYNNLNRRDADDYWVYPLIDWRKDIDTFFTTSTIDVREMLPTAVVHRMFTRLSNKIGFNFTGNYLTSSDHLNMVLTPNEFTNQITSNVKSSNYLTAISTSYLNIGTGSGNFTQDYFPTLRNENNSPDFALGVFKPTTNKTGSLRFVGEYDLYFSAVSFQIFGSLVPKQATVSVSITDVTGTIFTYGPIIYGPYNYGLNKFTIDIETPELNFIANTVYKVVITVSVPKTNRVQIINLLEYDSVNSTPVSLTYPHYMEFKPTSRISFGNPLPFTSLFTMKVVDVLKDILNMECLIVQTNNYTKNVQFNKFNDLVLNKSIAKDWSSKIQFNKTMGFKFGNYARRNNLRFKTGSYEDGIIWLSDETMDVEKDMVKLNHDPTFQYTQYSGYKIPTIDGLKDSLNEWLKPTYRLLKLKIQSTPFWINYTDGATTMPVNTLIPFCEFQNFSDLIDNNYGAITDILKSTKVLKVIANLDITDISNLDFSIPVQIQRPDLNISGYFYINKIENYKGGLTSCEIIEI
ncbi:hypothetical protein UFOVP598_18 [uncultured Caudovirales phage]|uniref:Uncharacterized protein n=1 Tax=uncultured Caudovirales phage TaxID=2100421 RepID=A0A6J5MVW9_9CAUD|nr:hypothetical protein UFOVP598_18 [uncultured Caudovirales phage]